MGPISAGRRGALGVANCEGDSRPGGGGVEERASGLELSGWVSMASGSEESKGWAAGWGWGGEGRCGAAGADVSASGMLRGLRGGGTSRAVQSLYPAGDPRSSWGSERGRQCSN